MFLKLVKTVFNPYYQEIVSKQVLTTERNNYRYELIFRLTPACSVSPSTPTAVSPSTPHKSWVNTGARGRLRCPLTCSRFLTTPTSSWCKVCLKANSNQVNINENAMSTTKVILLLWQFETALMHLKLLHWICPSCNLNNLLLPDRENQSMLITWVLLKHTASFNMLNFLYNLIY